MIGCSGLPDGGPTPLYLNECSSYLAWGGAWYVLITGALAATMIVPNVMDVGGDCVHRVDDFLETASGILLILCTTFLFMYYAYLAPVRWHSDESAHRFIVVHYVLALLVSATSAFALKLLLRTDECSQTWPNRL